MDRNLLKFLQKTGVDTRFISIFENKIYINNLKFSRFSRKKEEIFSTEYSQIEVIRSKIFQKICTRASRNLAHIIKPKENIFLVKNDDPINFALNVILEPYQRKYGINIIPGNDIRESVDLNVNSIASALTLDDEVENIIRCMLDGQNIELLSTNEYLDDKKIIYPLINVPKSWIYSWICPSNSENIKQSYESPKDLLLFLETIVPDVRENLYKSALFISH
ncbi:ATPase [Methanobacterium sp. ACI-7]|uniref:ATPase n=1 Tax=unclassified Methanobacterium TaxID=2627676 RepID=UPI0039C2EAFF